MTFSDVFYFVVSSVYDCLNKMQDVVIFESGFITDFPITLYDMFLGLFICSILDFLFMGFHDDDDYEYSYKYSIFEDSEYDGYEDDIEFRD